MNRGLNFSYEFVLASKTNKQQHPNRHNPTQPTEVHYGSEKLSQYRTCPPSHESLVI